MIRNLTNLIMLKALINFSNLHRIICILLKGELFMTNKNDNRERQNKYPNNLKNDTEFSKETTIRSEVTKKLSNK